MKKLFVSLLLFLSFSAFADGWIDIASNDNYIYQGLGGSLRISKNLDNEKVGVITGRVVNAQTQEENSVIWYVYIKECYSTTGTLVILNNRGEYVSESKYVRGSNTISDAISAGICEGVKQMGKKVPDSNDAKKGLSI